MKKILRTLISHVLTLGIFALLNPTVIQANTSTLHFPALDCLPGVASSISDQSVNSNSNATAGIQELVFIDAGLENNTELLTSVLRDIERRTSKQSGNSTLCDVTPQSATGTPTKSAWPSNNIKIEILDAGFDRWQQLSQRLKHHQHIQAVHLISHGSAGALHLGNQRVDSSYLQSNPDAVRSWKQSLSADADILLYGCSLGEDKKGVDFIQQLASLSGANIAASNDVTGNSSNGADWTLELSTGPIETMSLFSTDPADLWNGVLAGDLVVEDLSTNTSTAIAHSLLPAGSSGIVLSNITHTGADTQIGSFSSGLIQMPGVLDFDAGVVLSTGTAESIDGQRRTGLNTLDNYTDGPNSLATDADLLSLITDPVGVDPAALRMDFVPDGDFIVIEYVFGSDEYPEYVYSSSSDGVGFLIDKDGLLGQSESFVNVARNPAGQAINIDRINAASSLPPSHGSDSNDDNLGHDNTDGVFESAYPAWYSDNSITGTGTLLPTEMDGFTRTLSVIAEVSANTANTLKVGILDSGDYTNDSWLIIKQQSFQVIGADYGDAPDSYGTSIGSLAGAARHVLSNDLYMGATVDSDHAGASTTNGGTGPTNGFGGDGIDNSSGNATDDSGDDAVSIEDFSELNINSTQFSLDVPVTNGTTLNATLMAWIDFNANGVFDANESASTLVPSGTAGSSVQLNWTALDSTETGLVAGETYIRLRIATSAELTSTASNITLFDGEVEDHKIKIDTDTDGDGISDDLDSDDDNDGISDSAEGAVMVNGSFDPASSADQDNDNIPDYRDIDTDNDGIADLIEGAADTDGDGVADFRDTDSDNDTIDDTTEDSISPPLTGNDADYDGIDNALDVDFTAGSDTNNNGIDDAFERQDTDGDGVPDALDIDSDGDGIADVIEQQTDSDSDGTADYLDLDSDNDGALDSQEDSTSPTLTGIDSDADGIDDAIDVDTSGGADGNDDGIDDSLYPTDSDGDGIADYLDTDSDNDNIPDIVEGWADHDGDGTPDALDIDSDNDGIPDSVEERSMPELSGTDTDHDGIDDAIDVDVTAGIDTDDNGIDDNLQPTDTDSDGIPDIWDLDSENDHISDLIETAGTNGSADSDGDGTPDHLDLDSDNDGLSDDLEDTKSPVLSGSDIDSDGIDDALDVDQTNGVDSNANGVDDSFEATDSDADGIPDHLDVDSDNDGIPDIIESNVDSDGDNIPDHLDIDSDNDGFSDEFENEQTPPLSGMDSDADGIDDALDVDISGGIDVNGNGIDDEYEPSDTDGDGIPNHVDSDADNDGIPDIVEGSIDSDGDGAQDSLDTDSDNDRIPDDQEDTITPALTGSDADIDGIDDALDVDMTGGMDLDNNGVDDALQPPDTDGDGTPDHLDIDSDADNIPDYIERNRDADGDGVPNYLDTDSDNDGISDDIEDSITPPLSGSDSDADGVDDVLDTDLTGGIDADDNGVDDELDTTDSDIDGVSDYLDTDSDGDSIPDIIEGNIDSDGDAIPDFLDTDSDNDRIPDDQEDFRMPPLLGFDSDADGVDDALDVDMTGGVDVDQNDIDDALQTPDSDGDGISDHIDTDADGDGIADIIESMLDSDGDGIPDYLDTDSDNDEISDDQEDSSSPQLLGSDEDADGIDDALDAGTTAGPDNDENGISDYAQPTDSDEDGIPNHIDTDSDGDGIPDIIEGARDSDADGIPDNLDLDTDNDNIPDAVEDTVTLPLSGHDADADGIDDSMDVDLTGGTDDDGNGIDDARQPLDSDKDGQPDHADMDSDNDGITDLVEGAADSDKDGVPDRLDTDSDNDGIPDSSESRQTRPRTNIDNDGDLIDNAIDVDQTGGEDADGNGIDDRFEPDDTDADGTPDYLDTDADGDGIPDSFEDTRTPPLSGADSNANGIDDAIDASLTGGTDADNDGVDDAFAPTDTDNDGIADYLDLDADNDGIPDDLEDTRTPRLSGRDSDFDGVDDALDVDEISGTDANNNGILDVLEPTDSNGSGIPNHLSIDSDADGDGLTDAIEGLTDTDSDGVADWLDIDSDADSIPDSVEAGYQDSVPGDRDTDGVFDYLDADSDNDGISDLQEGAGDTDGDGVSDYHDLDSDNDGIYDIIEAHKRMIEVDLLDSDRDGVIDVTHDVGANGMANVVETEPESGKENYAIQNVDGDAVPDFRDRDSDNDGLLDTLESGHIDNDRDGFIDVQASLFDFFFDQASSELRSAGLVKGAGGVPRNTDNDALSDFRDIDSDNDSLTDAAEAFGPVVDLNGDGVYDKFADEDRNGMHDRYEERPVPIVDTDEDGAANQIDLDSDGDGLSDLIETGGVDDDSDGQIDSFVDADENGRDDGLDLAPAFSDDLDNDGTPNHLDLDSDADGVMDVIEGGGTDNDGDGRIDEPKLSAALPDLNGDGVPDAFELTAQSAQVTSGGSSGGCTISNRSQAHDPLLPLMVLLAMASLIRVRKSSLRTRSTK